MVKQKFSLFFSCLFVLGTVFVGTRWVWAQDNTTKTGESLAIENTGAHLQFLPFLAVPWVYIREAEQPDESSVGQIIIRSNACNQLVYGQLGTVNTPPFPAQAGYVQYENIQLLHDTVIYLQVRYSKNSPAVVPVDVFLDQESMPRVTFVPVDQGDWNTFTWTGSLSLGQVMAGTHILKFYTNGQQYGVLDLDVFHLSSYLITEPPPC